MHRFFHHAAFGLAIGVLFLSRLSAKPAKLPPAPALSSHHISYSSQYVCLGAFQPEGNHPLGAINDVWQDRQGRLSALSLNYVQSYASYGDFLTAISLTDPKERWFGGFHRVITDAAGNYYGADSSGSRIVVFGPDGRLIRLFGTQGDGDGELYAPDDLAFNPQGHLVVTDTFNHRLTVWTTDGHWVRAIPLPASIRDPERLRIDKRGHMFVLDRGLYELDGQGNFLRTLVPPIPRPGVGGLCRPEALALGADGCIYVSEYNPLGSRILKFDPNGHRFASIGLQNGVVYDRVSGLCVDAHGVVYAADSINSRVLVFAPVSRLSSHAQVLLSPLVPVMPPPRVSQPEYVFDRAFGGNQNTQGWVLFPNGIVIGQDGSVYVAGRGGVTRFTADGIYLKFYAEPLETVMSPRFQAVKKIVEPIPVRETGDRGDIQSIALDKHGNLFAAYSFLPVIVRWNADGSPPIAMTLAKRDNRAVQPQAIAVDSQDRLYVTDYARNEIDRYDEDGHFLDLFGPSREQNFIVEIAGIAIDDQDNVLVTRRGNRVTKIKSDGTIAWEIGKEGRLFGEFRKPYFVAVDHVGNVFVADSDNGRIQKFGPDGKFLTSFGEPNLDPTANTDTEKMLGSPMGLAVGTDGRVYAANMARITVFRPLAAAAKTP